MCLSIPSKVVEIDENNMATVDTMGVRRQVTLDLIDEKVEVGEYILIHVGYAMGKISEAEALESLKIYEEIVQMMDAGDIDHDEGVMGRSHGSD
ncbi:HypC/HybG/HupF family hydrogenase formation chaperone [Sulfurospirillum sp. T05]|uniref:HypC/HybG/HupF family hydrogenase formation chaperone n=1 Tax=Sulfurospirillum tamanense TaxID=2813362 RepID=A0ABS2WR64_9BACT|nr:HypC/HybG/HupF family hydrogenase formation chaperone [Sulfurospirillum tamanensis]MBN2964154.1 HypC/HybG/HupF family hydrogenase formation chaperone [Sulfurospirillum tamanensis]